MQGPILEMSADNNGFISCELDASGVNFKEKLQEVLIHLEPDQKIARKNLSLDIDNILGFGNFGDVIKGQINGNTAVVHVVSADDLDRPFQVKFLHELQNLLEFGYHTNILQFVGICKTHDWFFVVFDDIPTSLKEYLLSCRNELSMSTQRLSSLEEDQALKFVFEMTTAMEYLKHNKIVHKNLNSHNLRVKRQSSSLFSISISLFGPTLYLIAKDGSKTMIDDERWQAPEVMRFQKFSYASDVYSCALVIWEILCVGGTPYQTSSTSDLFAKIKKGIRPEKYAFISDDIYQLLLNCWQLDPSERFNFNDLVGQIKHFILSPHYYLNYSLDGPLPFYLPLLEGKT